ncbi:right-handed parallel beta-helix repeat-containing protein, partial [Methylobacter sp. BlB1]|nr:right-handed parallel beta-helix repeat-containing protein [Methylobacter sp. BlB1]
MKTIGKVSNTVAAKPLTVIDMNMIELAILKLIRIVIAKKHLLSVKAGLLLLCLFSSPAHAQNYYVCNNGSDSNTGLSIFEPWATFDFAMSRFGALNAGDSILLCRNGTFTSSFPRLFNQHCALDAPCTLADYIPPRIAPTSARLPVIKSSGANGVLNFQDGGNADHDEGYVVRNLSLKGNGTGNGIFLFNDVDYVTIEGV